MSLRTKIATLKEAIEDIADKIRELDGSSAAITPSEMPQKIQAIADSKREIEPKDYNFFDWDGTLVYSYDADELNALTELPSVPYHEGLTSEWNYTLAQLQSLTTLTRPLPANVGCIVKTPDGSTLLEIYIPEGDTKRNIELNLPCIADSVATVDWGDGTTETINATGSYITQNHTYADDIFQG